MNDFTLIIISQLGLLFTFVFLINFLTSGFILKYLITKASRGKKVLVEIYGVSDVYYKTGKIDEDQLKYRTRNKKDKSLLISKTNVFRRMGVNVISVDEINNAVLEPSFEGVAGFDAIRNDNLLVRALTAPQLMDTQDKIKLLLLIGACAGIGFTVFMLFNIGDQFATLGKKIDAVVPAVKILLQNQTGVI